MTLVAPRNVNDVSYVTQINHHIHFAWQVQYLVKLEVAPRSLNNGSYVTKKDHECYFVVQNSIGVVLCSTE